VLVASFIIQMMEADCITQSRRQPSTYTPLSELQISQAICVLRGHPRQWGMKRKTLFHCYKYRIFTEYLMKMMNTVIRILYKFVKYSEDLCHDNFELITGIFLSSYFNAVI
jgi:hypothetical protein